MANKCVASQYRIHIKPGSNAHQYNVKIMFHPATPGRYPRVLSECNDALQKARCRHILQHFINLNEIVYTYDGRKCLWTARILKNDVKNARYEMDNYLHGSFEENGYFSISMEYIRSIDLSDFSIYAQQQNNENEDRTHRNVLEMILSQNALEREINQFSGMKPGLMCLTDETPFLRGMVVRNGNKKGVHIVQSPDGRPQLVLAIKSTKKICYASGANFLDVVREFMRNRRNYSDYSDAEKAFRGVKLQLRYNPGRIITFYRFSDQSISETTCNFNGNIVNLQEYYFQTYNISLNQNDFLGAMAEHGNAVFPMEQLVIVPDQVVPDYCMPDHIREEALRLNRLPPNQRYDEIAHQFELLEMNNPVSEGFCVRIENYMIEGSFDRLNPVSIIARNNVHLFTKDDGTYQFGRSQYLIAGHVDRIIVFTKGQNVRNIMECVRAVVEECRRKGTVLPQPEHVKFDIENERIEKLIQTMKNYKKESNVLIIVVDESSEVHNRLKLAESLTGITTQHLLYKTASKLNKQYQTRENVGHKLNLKSRGFNVEAQFTCKELDLNRGNILVIGLDVCHPSRAQRLRNCPSFVGITGNYLQHPCAFAGSYFAQEGGEEAVNTEELRSYTYALLEKASIHRQIDTVVLMRDGVSEGQEQMVYSNEINAIKNGCFDFFHHGETSILGLILVKSGNVQHFNVSNGYPESLPPRSVVNFGVTENEFYCVPHRASNVDTAKSILVTVLKNDNFSKFDIQNFVLSLCNIHQICNLTVSLPEPIYQADKLAQRGLNVFLCFETFFDIPRQGQNGPIQFSELTALIRFNGEKLPEVRYTA